jgi:hypothetical protein
VVAFTRIPRAATGKDGVFHPCDEQADQWRQGCGSLANHDAQAANAVLSFVPIARACEALRLLPRVPTLRAHRHIKKGEEILFNYGSSLPFCPRKDRQAEESESAEEEVCAGPDIHRRHVSSRLAGEHASRRALPCTSCSWTGSS